MAATLTAEDQQSNSELIQRHFSRIQQVRKKYRIIEQNTYNMDEEEF